MYPLYDHIIRLFVLHLRLESPELGSVLSFAKRQLGLDPYPGLRQDYRALVVALVWANAREEIHLLYSTPIKWAREGFVSLGYWQVGTAESWDSSVTRRHPIQDALAEATRIMREAKEQGVEVITLDEAKGALLERLNYDHVDWFLHPNRDKDGRFRFPTTDFRGARTLLASCTRQLHYEFGGIQTFVWIDHHDRWQAYGRGSSAEDAVVLILGDNEKKRYGESRFVGQEASELLQYGITPQPDPLDRYVETVPTHYHD